MAERRARIERRVARVRRAAGPAGRVVRGARRRAARADRPERRRQDERAQLHLRPVPPRRRRHPVPGPRDHAEPAARHRARGDRPHLSACRAVRRHERGGEPPRRPPRAPRHRIARRRRCSFPACARPSRRTAGASRRSWISSTSSATATTGGYAAVRPAEDRRFRARARHGAAGAAARRALRRPQPRRARGPRALHAPHPARARHPHGLGRARHADGGRPRRPRSACSTTASGLRKERRTWCFATPGWWRHTSGRRHTDGDSSAIGGSRSRWRNRRHEAPEQSFW